MWATSLMVLMLLTGKGARDPDAAKKFDCAPKIEKMEKSCNKRCNKKKGPDKAICKDACAEGVKTFEDSCKEMKKNQGRLGKGGSGSGGGGSGGGGGGGGGGESEDVH